MNVGDAGMNNTLRAHTRRRLQLSLAAGALGATSLPSTPFAQAATFDLSFATVIPALAGARVQY